MLRTLRAALRTVVMTPLFLIHTMVVSARLNRVGKRDRSSPEIEAIAQEWARRFIRIPPITLTVEGLEHVDPEARYIVVSNHRSNFDIPVVLRTMPFPTRFISKQELAKIPIFGKAVVASGAVMIDRQTGRTTYESLNAAVIESFELGYSILLFAEGTRSRTGEMGKFHRGAARIAIATGTKILPIVIAGTFDVSPPGSVLIYPGEVTVRILPPVDVADATALDAASITDDLRSQIEANFEDMTVERHQS
ncbi:MAG: hypothetical protein BMS9Abin07_1500 [Acidimicrobiia bacterium]|nr:MAG: hypothetical protein BMS9Abin07_1500 [Acidimicrobiia bacterium]